MNVGKILQSDLINKSALAKALFPVNKAIARQRLYHKIKGVNGQRLTFADKERIKQIVKEALQ